MTGKLRKNSHNTEARKIEDHKNWDGKLRKNSHNTEARKIEDHKNWDGKLNYIKAGFMACRGKAIAADYVEPDMTDDITAVVTSLGSKLKNRDGFRRISPHLSSPQLYFE